MLKLFKSLLLTLILFTFSNIIKAQIFGPTSVCLSSTVNYLCNTMSPTYEWSVFPSGGEYISNVNSQATDIILPAAGNYTITVITTSPDDTLNISVSVYTTLPSPSISNFIFCENDSVPVLSVSPQSGGFIDWYADDLGTFYILPPTPTSDTTFYVIEILDACQSALTPVTATFYASPIITIGNNSPICEGQTIDLNSSGGIQYTWNGPTGFASSLQNPIILNASVSAAGTYSVVAIDTNGCSGTATTDVVISLAGTISGTVVSSGNPITSGLVYLYSPIPGATIYDTIASTNLNTSGQYIFSSVPVGDYIIKCIPDSITNPTLIGTYYGDVTSWNSADTIHQNCSTNATANINAIESISMTGPGVISGYVIEGIGFGQRLINSNNEVQVPGGPLKDIDVNLVSLPTNTIAAHTISDSVGYYEFSNVAVGNYTLQVDILGLPMDSSYFIIIDPLLFSASVNQTTSSVFTNLDFVADNTAIYITNSIGIKQNEINENGISIYPNPAKNVINIKFQLNDKITGQIDIIDNLGKTVTTQKTNSELTQVNIEDLNSGIYFIKVKSESGVNTFRFIKQN